MFSKDIRPMCLYCFYSERTFDGGESCICPKRGVVSFDYSCRKYKYDATKRIPPRPQKFSAEDINIAEI